MMGWSTSPSTKSTTTSWPMRGRWTPPNWVPAPSIATRTQQELLASDWPSRSQWNWILTRPYLSGKISSPAGPTTTAVCTPPMRGAGVMRGGRNGKAMGMQVKELEYSVVYAKPPFGGPQQVLEYLGRYTHRVAISNQRLQKLEDAQVTFEWKDYRDTQLKPMTLSADEFIRRFLLHALPPGFQRIRYYGFLANCHRAARLKVCRRLLATTTAD